jgi:hypothetical protein
LVALAAALGEIRGQPVTLGDLVRTDGFLTLTDDLVLHSDALQRYLRGEVVDIKLGDLIDLDALVANVKSHRAELDKLPPPLSKVKFGVVGTVNRQAGEAEDRVAKALGVETWVVNQASAYLWESTVSAERDRRGGPNATPQARGRITRQLREELKAALNGDD